MASTTWSWRGGGWADAADGALAVVEVGFGDGARQLVGVAVEQAQAQVLAPHRQRRGVELARQRLHEGRLAQHQRQAFAAPGVGPQQRCRVQRRGQGLQAGQGVRVMVGDRVAALHPGGRGLRQLRLEGEQRVQGDGVGGAAGGTQQCRSVVAPGRVQAARGFVAGIAAQPVVVAVGQGQPALVEVERVAGGVASVAAHAQRQRCGHAQPPELADQGRQAGPVDGFDAGQPGLQRLQAPLFDRRQVHAAAVVVGQQRQARRGRARRAVGHQVLQRRSQPLGVGDAQLVEAADAGAIVGQRRARRPVGVDVGPRSRCRPATPRRLAPWRSASPGWPPPGRAWRPR
jgi:hypothetical protein